MPSPRKTKATIKRIEYFSERITRFHLLPEIRFSFKPGQFLHLAMDPYDPSFYWPESRVFSIANSPTRVESIKILVSPKGSFTNKMIDELKPGDEVWLKLPFGSFNLEANQGADIVLIAGGTGISPFISFLEYIIDKGIILSSLKLYYGVRNPDLIIYEDLLSECSSSLINFSHSLYVEKEFGNSKLKFSHGILPVKDIIYEIKPYNNPVFYLSGPKVMINSFELELKKKGITEERIFIDKWE
jgi:ferredoxin-NADP reductase